MAKRSTPSPARLSLVLNGRRLSVPVAHGETLLSVLRRRLRLTGTKPACEQGECGACAVRVDGELIHSCLCLAQQAEGRRVDTIEGLGRSTTGRRLQEAFVAEGASQCGYCTPGMLMAAADLLAREKSPSAAEIRCHLEGNLCRCTGYNAICAAVARAAGKGRKA